MGYSSSSSSDYAARTAYRQQTNSSFAYDRQVRSLPRNQRKVHEMLDPKRINSNGEKIRECLDSDEHPETLPVVVAFDETGSMGEWPRKFVSSLATLKGVTLKAGLLDAQLCFGAYGDAHNNETAPVQIGHFESGLETEEWLNNIFLEANGGGNGGETAGLLLYFLATHSRLDSFDKRGKRGYLFLTGDEISHPYVTKQEVKTYLDENIEADIPIDEVVKMAQRLYDIYFLLVDNPSATWQGSKKFWSNLLGEDHVIVAENLDHISEVISMVLVHAEGVVDDTDEAERLLIGEGADSSNVKRASKDLQLFTKNRGTVAKTVSGSGTLEAFSGSSNSERL